MRTAAIAFLTVGGTLLLAALAITLYGHRHELDWGNVPTWFAGLFAVIASAISLRNYLVARASYEHNLEKRDDDYAAQARLVVVDVERFADDTWLLNIKNHSDSIIFDANLKVFEDVDGFMKLKNIYNDGRPLPDDFGHETLLPGGSSTAQGYDSLYAPLDYLATFTDARGTKWRRANRDQPTRVLD